jgi:hypothetical protein
MWPGTESNRRHEDFQSSALPTELPGHTGKNNYLAGLLWGFKRSYAEELRPFCTSDRALEI